MPQPRLQFLLCLLAYTLVLRVLPYVLMNCDLKSDPSVLYYPWNFTPMTAVCLFGGACLANRRVGFLIPLATLFLSDLGIAVVSGHPEWALPVTASGEFTFARLVNWSFTYVGFSLAVALGRLLRNRRPMRVSTHAVVMGLGFETVFFLVSNFLVWTNYGNSTTSIYPYTAAGLASCYVAGLPFFGKSLLGTTAFTMLLFSPLGVRAATDAHTEPMTGELELVRASR